MQLFKRLRNRLLILNMILITILVFAAFITIYLVTLNQVKNGIDTELQQLANMRQKNHPDGPTPERQPPDDGNFEPGLPDGIHPPRSIPEPDFAFPDRSIAFSMVTDDDGTVLAVESFLDMESGFYSQALDLAEKSVRKQGRFHLEGYEWAWHATTGRQGRIYLFIDVTTRMAVLDRLIVSFALAAVLSLIIIFAISYFLTSRSIQPVREAFDKQKQFISNASHELKTPLTIIGTNIDLVLRNNPGKDDVKWLQYIRDETERMSRLTNDLLKLTRMESDEGTSRITEKFCLSDEVEGALLGVEGWIYESGRRLEYSIAPGIVARGDRGNITRIVTGLIENAVKYSERNGLVRIILSHRGRNAVLKIANSGPGIAAEDLPNIFDRFYRADASRNRSTGSYGLGLAITKAAVEQEGGTIVCESVPGKETVFTVRFRI